MSEFIYTVTVTTDTAEQAERVMAERLGHDEDYGFQYLVDYQNAGGVESLVCPLCGGVASDDLMPAGLIRCIDCSETLYYSELVPAATHETRETYYRVYPDARA